MSIEWIDVRERVPDNRRLVLVYTYRALPIGGRFGYALTKYNRSRYGGGDFDIERESWLPARVLCWADLAPPLLDLDPVTT